MGGNHSRSPASNIRDNRATSRSTHVPQYAVQAYSGLENIRQIESSPPEEDVINGHGMEEHQVSRPGSLDHGVQAIILVRGALATNQKLFLHLRVPSYYALGTSPRNPSPVNQFAPWLKSKPHCTHLQGRPKAPQALRGRLKYLARHV